MHKHEEGKEIEVMTVNYAPGAADAIHQHDAHEVVYVLYGEVEMQVPGDDRSWSDQAQSSNPGAHAERPGFAGGSRKGVSL